MSCIRKKWAILPLLLAVVLLCSFRVLAQSAGEFGNITLTYTISGQQQADGTGSPISMAPAIIPLNLSVLSPGQDLNFTQPRGFATIKVASDTYVTTTLTGDVSPFTSFDLVILFYNSTAPASDPAVGNVEVTLSTSFVVGPYLLPAGSYDLSLNMAIQVSETANNSTGSLGLEFISS